MNEEVIPPLSKSGIRWLWISLLVIVVDQLTKLWIENSFVLGERIELLPILEFTRAHNPGAAFSFGADGGAVSVPRALHRYALALLGFLAVGLGFLWALVDRDRQFLHDRLAGTAIVEATAPPRA